MKSIMSLQKDDKAVKAAKDLCYETHGEDRSLFDRAKDLQHILGLSGLWKGADLALAEIIKALQAENVNTEMTEQVKEENVREIANETELEEE